MMIMMMWKRIKSGQTRRSAQSALVGYVCHTAGGIFIVAALAFASAHASIADSYKLSPVSPSSRLRKKNRLMARKNKKSV